MNVEVKQVKKTVRHTQLAKGELFCATPTQEYAIWYMSLGNGNHVDLRDGAMYSDKLLGSRELIPGRLSGITVEVV